MRAPEEAELLARARARLDRLSLYPRPVDVSRVSIHIVPWLFRVSGFRRFRGYATFRRILLAGPGADEDLVVHELCHIWQAQHRPIRMWLSYARPSTFSRDRRSYRANRYEREARHAVESTRAPVWGEDGRVAQAHDPNRSRPLARGTRAGRAGPAHAQSARRAGDPPGSA